ncbi:TadE/TadG family type IV pilus assembly protein [Roseicitreum antarcticum]|uniref:Flp pilus assembly protein TadG n=1 Tax=Roseicitreum antarcticum TaxID=564137 RepID=A0A1H2TCZ4_9RHOB|nr:TadE/TadG family type IV pilus assembly protein [Roseicitreum antarcticum]SDW41833.1 Flp pilus assembly protein TadG [Roseicitreum antarcticum]
MLKRHRNRGHRPLRSLAARLKLRLAKTLLLNFTRREDGAMLIFGLFIMVIILMVCGMAVDLMRVENQRVRLQSVSDRATLAAASLRQPLEARAVVERYFEMEGLSAFLENVDVDQGINHRTVEVRTRAIVPSLFLRMVGISDLPVATRSTAQERFLNVEVSLVVDVSESMNQLGRIQNLRSAGEDFIDQLFAASRDDQISVNLVPYAGQTNAGPDLYAMLETTHDQPASHCVEFDASDYTSMAFDRTGPYAGAGHFDPWSQRGASDFFCPTRDDNSARIMPLADDPDVLRARMRDLTAQGNTSIEIGLKWGAALLDASFRPYVSTLVEQGIVSSAMANRPFDAENAEAMKAVVLMTDGENFDQFRMRDQYKTGRSGVWHTVSRGGLVDTEIATIQAQRLSYPHNGLQSAGQIVEGESRLSVFNPQRNWWTRDFFVPRQNDAYPRSGSWSDYPSQVDNSCTLYGPTQGQANRRAPFNFYLCNNVIAYEVPYDRLWHDLSVYWVAAYLYHYPGIMNYNTYRSNLFNMIQPNTKNAHLSTMCDTLRDAGVIVYTIAFEAPQGGQAAMRDCAFSANHYFDVSGTDLQVAFRAIAGDIQQLRLIE